MKDRKYIFNCTHASLYTGAAEDSHSLVLFIAEQQLEVKYQTLENDSSALRFSSSSSVL